MNAQRTLPGILGLALAALIVGTALWDGDASPPPIGAASDPEITAQRIKPASGVRDLAPDAASNEPVVPAPRRDAASDLNLPGLGDAPIHALTLQLHGPEEWLQGIPVGVIWNINADHRPLENEFVTDSAGRARVDFVEPEQRPQWFWADLSFPTLGRSAKPIPPEGGVVTLPMVMPSYVDVEVVEQDGTALYEPVRVELRVPAARAPGNRWHPVPLQGGRGQLPVETDIELLARVTTPSGRSTSMELRASSLPEDSVPCKLVLDSAGALTLDLRGVDAAPLANTQVRLVEAQSRKDALRSRPVTDDAGRLRFRLPRRFGDLFVVDLIVSATVDGEPHGGELHIDYNTIRDGGHTGVLTLLPVPVLLGGVVTDAAGSPRAGTDLVLELGVDSDKRPGELAWQPIANAISQAAGEFAFRGQLPRDGELRVRENGVAVTAETPPAAVRMGHFDQEIVVPPRSGKRP